MSAPVSDPTNTISRISIQDFNALPTVQKAWETITKQNECKDSMYNDQNDFRDILNQTIGSVLIKHGVENEFSAVLNHMHYKLIAGEHQVTVNPKPIKSNVAQVYIDEYLAEPIKSDFEKEKLIPIKWRLNNKTNKLESYEYLIGDLQNADKYRKIAAEFESNIKLQNEIKAAISQTGYDEYFGILLRYTPSESEAVELNSEKNRQSKTSVFSGDSQQFKQLELYQQIMKMDLIQTSWIFYKVHLNQIDNENKLSCGICYCSHCGSHCVSHK